MRRLPSVVLTSSMTILIALAGCGERTADYEEDHSEEVARICQDFCQMNVACHEPNLFETEQECWDLCVEPGVMYEDNTCGEAYRDLRDCVGATTTCEEYLDTNNVHADDYICKAQKDLIVALSYGDRP